MIVARYQSGHNAGHTVRAGERKMILKLAPRGLCGPEHRPQFGMSASAGEQLESELRQNCNDCLAREYPQLSHQATASSSMAARMTGSGASPNSDKSSSSRCNATASRMLTANSSSVLGLGHDGKTGALCYIVGIATKDSLLDNLVHRREALPTLHWPRWEASIEAPLGGPRHRVGRGLWWQKNACRSLRHLGAWHYFVG